MFVVVAYVPAWCLTAPLWRGDGAPRSLLVPLGLLVTATPALGGVVAALGVLRAPDPALLLGLVPLRPWRRMAAYSLVGLAGVLVLASFALVLGAVMGAVVALRAGGNTVAATPATAWSALTVVPALSLLTVPALCEELGWRGFLLAALRPLGTWPALIASGLAWAGWSAPLLALVHREGLANLLGILLVAATTVLVGVLLGWLRMRSGSVWPATIAHAALEATVILLLVAFLPGGTRDAVASLLGWTGWLLVGSLAAVVALAGTFHWEQQTDDW